MDRLTKAQAKKVQAVIGRQLRYLNDLQARMKAVGLKDEHLLRDVAKARNAVNDLWMTLHYLGCDSGVG